MMLCGLRVCAHLPFKASIRESNDLFLAFVDKRIPGRRGAIPIILSPRAREVIRNWRNHCSALASRLKAAGNEGTGLCRWLVAVADARPVPLIQTANTFDHLVRLGSTDVILHAAEAASLPADPGRKWIENHLRKTGFPTALIDAAMRHETSGIENLASTSNFSFIHVSAEIAKAIDDGFSRFFAEPLADIASRVEPW
jgi:hypothetical protein